MIGGEDVTVEATRPLLHATERDRFPDSADGTDGRDGGSGYNFYTPSRTSLNGNSSSNSNGNGFSNSNNDSKALGRKPPAAAARKSSLTLT